MEQDQIDAITEKLRAEVQKDFRHQLDEIQKNARKSNEEKRSLVRRVITYAAASFLFIGGAIFIGALYLADNKNDQAKDLFLTILPVSSAVISYWFASREKDRIPQGNREPSNN